MDQLKQYLRVMKRHHFWALSGFAILVSLVAWFLTVRSLAAQRGDNQTMINTSYQNVVTVRAKENHVNENTREEMEKLIALRREEVREAWQSKYDEQSGGADGHNILEWPQELNERNPDLIPFVQKLWPIEQHENPNIPIYMRQDYKTYIKSELPKLATTIGAVWAPDLGGTVGLSVSEEEEPPSFARSPEANARRTSSAVVHWNPDDQQFIQSQYFDWSRQDRGLPTSKQMLYAQEDLWVLTALVEIIKRTNGNATVRHNAKIKEIERIRMGKYAVGRRGHVLRVVEKGSAPTDATETTTYAEDEPLPAIAEGEGGEVVVDPADKRYVDKDYNALDASRLNSGGASDGAEDASAYLRVAKRMPIRMRVKMNQLYINRLLVECANFPLTVEVRQVRVNPQDSLGSSGRGAGQFDMSGEGEFSEPRRFGGMGTNPRFGSGPDVADAAFPYDVTVEIYGIIYIYNPVDNQILGEPEATADFAST